MVIDITGISSSQATQSRGKVNEQPAAQSRTPEAATTARPASSSSVNISDTAQAIQKSIDNNANDGVNAERVAELRAAIEDGSYQVDAFSTAQSLFQIESQLDQR